LLFGVGINSDAGLTGSIVLNERNFDILRPPTSIEDLFTGDGSAAPVRNSVWKPCRHQVQRYSASFREPHLFDSQFSFGISAYYYQRIFNEYTESRLGTRITFGTKLNQEWSASLGFAWKMWELATCCRSLRKTFRPWSATIFSSPRIGLTRDTRNSYLRPTEGSILDFGVEQVLGDFNFPVFTWREANTGRRGPGQRQR